MDDTLFSLIQKYDKSGPRYTSYPAAPMFSSSFGAKEYREAILETEEQPSSSALSLYMHVPFCDTLCYFCGCTRVITHNQIHLLSCRIHWHCFNTGTFYSIVRPTLRNRSLNQSHAWCYKGPGVDRYAEITNPFFYFLKQAPLFNKCIVSRKMND